MILDNLLTFGAGLNINTGGAGTYLLGNVIDLQAQQIRDIGNGQPLYWVTTISSSLLSATGTINFQLVSDAQAAIATDGSATVHAQTGAKAQGLVVAGNKFVIPVPLELPTYERYLGLLQITATAAFTAGAIQSSITMDPVGWKPYPDGVN